MTPKESYRVARRSLRFDLAKTLEAMSKIDSLGARWRRLPAVKPPRAFKGAAYERRMRELERYLRDTWAPTPGFKYLSKEHPVRLAAQEKAKAYIPHHLDDYVWRSGDATLPPPVEYVKPQPLRKSKLVDKADPYYTPPQLWMPEHMEEAAVSFGQDDYEMSDDSSTPALELVDDSDWWETSKRTDRDEQYKPVRSEALSDPLVQMLQAEGSYDEASDLCRMHRAGFAHNSMNFYMQQRPDMYPQTLPGTVWVSQANGSTAEVKPYIRNPRKVA